MAAQVGPRAIVIESIGLLQLVKHAHKAQRREPGGCHQPVADAVRLPFHVAREVQLVLHGQGLAAHHQGLRGAGVLARRQGAQHQCPQQQRGLLALLRDQARDMALGHMAEFVRQHRCEFITRRHHPHQAQMHPQVATGQGKRVYRAVPSQQNLPGEALVQLGRQFSARPGRFHQRLPDALHIVCDDRIVDVVGVPVQLADDAVAQSALGAGGEIAAFAQGGQMRLGMDWENQANCYKINSNKGLTSAPERQYFAKNSEEMGPKRGGEPPVPKAIPHARMMP